uniref:KIB1-4 beta-propeller domain-containing protein n=1 Tax=Aegilops tauschii TaxID=37682 RepID=R7WCV8_AEGTA
MAMLALIPDVSVQLDLAHTLLTFWTFMRTWANIQQRAHSISKALTEMRKESLLYKMVMASFRKRGRPLRLRPAGPRRRHTDHGTAIRCPGLRHGRGGGRRLAPSHEGVEDAVHYNGKFHSITYAGAVEMWEQDGNAGGVFTSMVVAPRLPNADGDSSLCCRKYLVAAAGRRLMVVLKEFKEETTDKYSRPRRTCSFKVQALTANSGGKRTISGTPHCLWG